ncbi:MAG: 2-amino-4-hydroxy-6-hydroxymethyldihydropteridine diphosphokinase [Coriobacteriia bacterium]
MIRVHLGLGSNLGDRIANLTAALREIDSLPHTGLIAVSQAYESEAWPHPDDPPYANAVAIVETRLPVPDLYEALRDIEVGLGRDLKAPRNAPRSIDLDILLAGDQEWERPDLVIPHPRMRERDFVITPLLELTPDARWPDGSPVTRDEVRVGRVTASLGPVPGLPGHAPGPDTEWVEVRRFSGRANFDANEAADIAFVTAMLSSAGIPYALDPPPGAEGAGPYPFLVFSRLLVPADRASGALEFLADVVAAPFDFEDAYRMARENPAESDLSEEPDE